ncbi:hypothetical protein LOK74_02105 [Brevibacillus humidisoli]|uniref:hypothetical protein n=1 Tax=Brevibacillus humidisoli TaxID=2895522 RepID=UPI001E4226E0|nr:hypothetical protein [Brevibacillus humidisoli]UFJ41354.1 hypothetical protein LOK74_02105 [Brevibacillus humidisoli]
MFGIVSANLDGLIQEAIGEPPIFQSDGSSIRDELDAAARAAIRTLVIDLDCLAEDEGLMALRSYRRRRPHTRIILLGINRVPGDSVLARCVSLGIYDVVNIETDGKDEEQVRSLILSSLQRQLAQPAATYADAARWDIYDSPFSRVNKTVKSIGTEGANIKSVVIKERLIGTPVIVITSATKGSGCTYAAIQLAQLLQNFGKVACLELQHGDSAGSLPLLTTEHVEGVFQVKGMPHIDFAYVKRTTDVTKQKKYDWIVVDAGYWKDRSDDTIDEWERATVGCVTVAPSPWGYFEYLKQMDSISRHRQDWILLLQHPSAGQEKKIKQDMAEYCLPIYSLPYQPEVFSLSDETAGVLQSAFHQTLPQSVAKKRITFRFPWWRSS